jgi:glucokinase
MIPSGGVYIAGGIASKFKEYFLSSGKFIEGFLNKPKHAAAINKSIPVYYIKHEVGLDGAKILARRIAKQFS